VSGNGLVLSIFPGIDLLGRAFEENGYCIVRGPDVLWGGDIRTFKPPAGVFEGVIGGPPCQPFSRLVHLVRANGYEPRHGNLIPEFERVASDVQPEWWLMEEVPAAPIPSVSGYITWDAKVDNRWVGGEQERRRRFSFGTRDGRPLPIEYAALQTPERYETVISGNGFGSGSDYYRRVSQAVVGAGTSVPVKMGGSGKVKASFQTRVRRSIGDLLEAQGFAADLLDEAPFTNAGKLQAIANGVPLPMGRAIAHAVRRAMEAPRCSVPHSPPAPTALASIASNGPAASAGPAATGTG
jgi:DNA (cytosine-5)-methyltransferase 1